MSARRLRHEMNIWRGVWQQLATFFDRIEETAEMEQPAVQTICALLPVMGVLERAYGRLSGKRLGDALSCSPRGKGQPARSLANLGGANTRLPGVEDQEYAAGTPKLKVGDDESIEDADLAEAQVILWDTVTLFTFRDEKHGEVAMTVPAYEFGPLQGGPVLVSDAMKVGHFGKQARETAVETGEDTQLTWSKLREKRRDKLEADAATAALSVQLGELTLSSEDSDFTAIATQAYTARDVCENDAAILGGVEPSLTEAGVASEVISALAAAKDTLQQQARDFKSAADKLSHPNQLNTVVLDQIKDLLAKAERPDGLLGLPLTLLTLDTEASKALDEAVSMRIAYPDGSLRMLRMMEASLRWQWGFRRRWFSWRRQLVLGPLYLRAMVVFCDNLRAIRQGTVTGAPVTGVKLYKDATTQATSLSITPRKDLSKLQPGQIAILRGDRPALLTLLGSELKPGAPGQPTEQLIAVTPLNLSLSTDVKVPGIAGLAVKGTAIDGGSVSISDQEIRSGKSAAGPQADALPLEVVALGTKLQLLLGLGGRDPDVRNLGGDPPNIVYLPGRPAPPSIPAPYPGIAKFDVEEPVSVGATRLFLKQVPPAAQSGSNQPVMMARPGELMLIRGADTDGAWWQGVIEVAQVDVMTGTAARADDETTGTPAPVCCEAEELVVVIMLRDMQIPHDLVRNVTLSRTFDGFGCASLAAREVLPEVMDQETKTIHVNDPGDGNEQKIVLRDPELRAAVKILDTWFGVGT